MTDPLEKSILTQAEYFKDIVATIREPLLVLDASLRVLAANRSFYKFFKVKAGETIGRLVYDLGDRQWDIPGLRLLLETILPQKALFNDFNVEHDFPVIGRRILLLNARRIPKPPKEAQWILLAFEDVTQRMELERSLQASEKQFHAIFETASDSMLLVDKISGQVLNSNRAAQDSLGYSNQKLLKKNLWELGILKDRRQFRRISIELEKQGVVGFVDTTIPTSQGGDYPADITIMDRLEVIQCNIHDITERKQSEGAIHELARFPTENPNPVMRIDRGGNLLYANESALVQLEEWKLEFFSPVPKVLSDPIQEVFKTGTTNTVELTCGGRIFSIAIGPTPEGNDVNIYGVDITERKLAQEKLSESENELRVLFAGMTDVVIVLDGNGRYLRIAPTNPINLYHPPEDLLGKTVQEVLPKEQADFIIATIGEAIQTKQTVLGEYALQIDGKEIWFASSTSRLSENSVIWVAHDITKRKQAEAALRESEQRYRTLAEASSDIIFVIDRADRIQYVNTFSAQQFGMTPEQVIGQARSALFPPDIAMQQAQSLQSVFANGQPAAYDILLRFSEHQMWVSSSLVPLRDKSGAVTAVMGISRDITKRKQAEEQIQKMNADLEQRVEERTRDLRQVHEQLVREEKLAVLGQLAGGVGHELLNPLGVISNSVYYLKMVQPDANEKIRKHHAMIEQELHIATRIVNDLLDYAREISTDPQPGSVRDIIEQTLSHFPVPASIQISLKIPDGLPPVYADPLHVEQVLGNLITNACQAMSSLSLNIEAGSATISGGGKLTVTARQVVPVKSRDRQKQMVAIAVKDTGTGITPGNMEKLFEPLFSTKAKGIGLGLAVSRKLAEANGGRIEVKSQVGKGSTFTLYLPVKADK
ncbi:MAG: PAS domain S-box protein [Anaerolineales bacterium]